METTNFSSLLNELSQISSPVIDSTIPISSYFPIDLSPSNQEFYKIDYNSAQVVESFLQSIREEQKCEVLYGGYLEERNIYKRSTHFNNTEIRNIHLGLDLWAQVSTKAHAVLDGEIHSFNNNTNYGDYGPTLIVEHNFDGIIFYSLYGHLSVESLQNKFIRQKVKQGEVIAYLGNDQINGNYAPHLHFQLIRDLNGFSGDYPGVCSNKMKSFFMNNCPDPNLLLKLN